MSRPITVLELSEALDKMLQEGKGDYPICVAFRWKGDTVMSDITSWCLNGNSIQLNEEDFMRHATLLNELGYDTSVISGIPTKDR